jgi:Tol biopolymer transport system component
MGESRIHAFSIDGPSRLDLTGVASIGSDSAASLSPDRRTIAFLRTGRATDTTELWLADADGGSPRRLLAPGLPESFTYSDSEPYFQAPAWSPQGDTIAIDVVSTATCGPGHTKCASWFTALVGLDGRRRDIGGVNAVWSPTGSELLVRGGLFSLEEPNEWSLGVERSDGSVVWGAKSAWKRPEACWARGSWSPDGARLVLSESRCDSSARRLHIVGAHDGERRAVLRGCCASWSQDGRHLWYVAFGAAGNALTVVTRDGRRPRRVGGRMDLVGWSPRGDRVALVRHARGDDELVLARADGTHPHVLARTMPHGLEVVSWSGDGERFAFFRRRPNGMQLVVARGDGSHPRVLAHTAGRILTSGSWSPNGRRLSFWDTLEGTASRLRVADAATGRVRTVYRALEGAYAFGIGWITDDRTVLVQETVGGLYPEELWTVRPDGSGLRRLTSNKREELGPAWSPDGSLIAFWRDDPKQGRKPEDLSVYVMRANGENVRKVVGGPRGSFASDPDWSPDGRSLAFVRWPDGNHTDVWLVRRDGTALRRLTRSGHAYAPAWAPDGRSIAFSDDGVAKLVALDGSRPTPLLDPGVASYCSGFAWSPDRHALASACQIPGLILTRQDGSDVRNLDRGGSAPSWSPDGNWLVYEADGLRIVSADGGTPVSVDVRGATAKQPDWSPR